MEECVTRMVQFEYKVEAPFGVIRFNNPGSLNAFERNDYLQLAQLLEEAGNDADVYFTVLQSTGRFFSSGADFRGISRTHTSSTDEPELNKWLSNFVSTNLYVTDIFARHSKILICCLNGPAIGMTAALCALCDIVYAKDESVYLMYPFARLGLVTEGATSVTIPLKLGNNIAYEFLMFGKPIGHDQLKDKIITKTYYITDTDHFNQIVMSELREKTKSLHLPSCLGMKKLMKANLTEQICKMNSIEVNDALPYWLKGEPQKRFAQLGAKSRKSKL